MSELEDYVRYELEMKGGVVHTSGWPDFLFQASDGSLAGIEAKAGRDHIRPNQASNLLSLSKVMPIYVATWEWKYRLRGCSGNLRYVPFVEYLIEEREHIGSLIPWDDMQSESIDE